MFDMHDLDRCRAADLASCDAASLVDLRDIHIDIGKSLTERVTEYLEQVKNPYLFKVGDIVVKVNYGGVRTLSDSLTALFPAD